jgi:hypothetical protein
VKLREGGVILNDHQLFRLYFLGDRYGLEVDKKPSKFSEAVKPYIVKTVTTDFEGNATFESVPEGNYFI